MFNSTKYSLIIDDDSIPRRENEQDFNNEWFEDAPNDADWFDNFSTTACSFSESTHSASFPDEFYEKNKFLENELKESELRYQNLNTEHQNMITQLSNEKQKSNKLQRKLQCMEDNHLLCTKLKEAYLNMKNGEATSKKSVDVKDQACQTWAGIICQSCVATHEMARQLKLSNFNDPSMITVKRCDLAKLQETVQKLKAMIDDREKTWSYNNQKTLHYKTSITELQNKVMFLNEIISKKPSNTNAIKTRNNHEDIVRKENAFLRKIIIKLEKRHRDMERMYNMKRRQPLTLSEMEQGMIQELIRKYSSHLKRKVIVPSSTNCSSISSYNVCATIDEEDSTAFDENEFNVDTSDCGSSIF